MQKMLNHYIETSKQYHTVIEVRDNGETRLHATFLPDKGLWDERYITGRLTWFEGAWELEWTKGNIDTMTKTGKGFYCHCPEAERTGTELPSNRDEIAEIVLKAFRIFVERKGFRSYREEIRH